MHETKIYVSYKEFMCYTFSASSANPKITAVGY